MKNRPPVSGAVTRRDRHIHELRRIAEAVQANGDHGIAALIFYAAELLERRASISAATVEAVIHGR